MATKKIDKPISKEKTDKTAIPAKDKIVLTKEQKIKAAIRKIVYFLLFALIIYSFIALSNKYAVNENQTQSINDYYENLEDGDVYEVINGTEMINKIKKGKNIIFVGSKTSDWSIRYAEIITPIFNIFDVDKVYYYDLNNDKSQKNSNYYEIKELLKGYLTTTDGSKTNLLAPSLYIIEDGKVLYYNTDTVAMRNTTDIDEYWNEDKVTNFQIEFEQALINYYLNNN